jgi:hypothetical protein
MAGPGASDGLVGSVHIIDMLLLLSLVLHALSCLQVAAACQP